MVSAGRTLPLTKSVVVERDAVLDLIDQLRVAIPEEIRTAKRINAESERIVDAAREAAEETISRAQEQAAFMIGERGLLEAAEAEGRRIVEAADAEAEDVRRGADDYASGILGTLQGEVERFLVGIRKGMAVLDERRPDLLAPPAAGVPGGDEFMPDDGYGASADPDAEDDDLDDQDIVRAGHGPGR